MNEERDLSNRMRAITISREYGSGGGEIASFTSRFFGEGGEEVAQNGRKRT